MSVSSPATRPVALPSAPVLVGGFYAATVLGTIAWFAGVIAFTDQDPRADDGPVESMLTIGVIGTGLLVLCVGIGLALVREPARARGGAVACGTLAVASVVVFWSGAPAILGATAAWLAGLTKGGRPLGGSARVMGLVGLFLAVTNVLLLVIAYVADA